MIINTARHFLISAVLLLNGCYMISDPDMWPKDFVPKNVLPGLIGKSEDEVLEAIGPPDYVISKTDSTSYLYQSKEHDTAIIMMLYIPMPLPPYEGYETNCVLLIFDEDEIFSSYEISSRGAALEANSNPTGGCRNLFGIADDDYFMSWCLYERLRNNQQMKAIEVRREYQQYTSRPINDPIRLKWLCRAADHGHPNAQAEVGRYYWENVKNDDNNNLVQAFVWYELAAQSTCLNFSMQLEKIVNRMKPEQASEAAQLSNNWAPGQCDEGLSELTR